MLMLGKKELLIVLNINKKIRSLTQIFSSTYLDRNTYAHKCLYPYSIEISTEDVKQVFMKIGVQVHFDEMSKGSFFVFLRRMN